MKGWGGYLIMGALIGVLAATVLLPGDAHSDAKREPGYCRAVAADGEVAIDGRGDEAFWKRAEWVNLDQCFLGPCSDPKDFSGRFKAAWKGSEILLLVEITDNRLTDALADDLADYWQGDYVGIYIDEDRSGGPHQTSHNAFAYHVLPWGNVIDVDTDGEAKFFTDAVRFAVVPNGDKYTWELAVTVYSENYDYEATTNETVKVALAAGKKLGFGVAYCDNDGNGRKSLYGNVPDQGDTGHITADQFGTLELVR